MLRPLAISLCLGCLPLGTAHAAGPTDGGASAPLPTEPRALGQEFQRLRKLPGHMQRQSGPWTDEVDAFGGRKQQVMNALQKHLQSGTHTCAEIVDLMGEPDQIVSGEGLRPYPVTGAKPSEVLIYQWRGAHDYLYFVIGPAGALLRAEWWYAGE